MARGKEITADKLEALGTRRLAELLAKLSVADPVVRKAAKLALAAGENPTKLLAEIDKRIRTTACSKTLINWDRREPLVQELENLRTTITGTLARRLASGWQISFPWLWLFAVDHRAARRWPGLGHRGCFRSSG
jgi:hypothetical protein